MFNKNNVPVGHINQIDGLKAIAISIVLCWHIGLRGVRKIDTLNSMGFSFFNPYRWLPHGEVAVDIFFVLSGIVIGLYFLKRSPKDWNLTQFYKRRFWRIYPPYLITVICCAAFLYKHIQNIFSYALVSAFYLNSIVFNASSYFNPPFWSLEVEIEFYFFVPIFVLIYRIPKSTKMRALISILTMSLVAFFLSIFHTYYPFDGRFRFSFPAHLHFFITGIVLADIILNKSNLKRRRFDALFILSLAAIYVSGLWLTCVNAEPKDTLSWFITAVCIVLLTCGLIIGGIRGLWASQFLSHPWVGRMGVATYSIYLVHIPVIEMLNRVFLMNFNPKNSIELWLVWCLSSLFSVGIVSALFFCLVERPFFRRVSKTLVSAQLPVMASSERLPQKAV